jgi:L-ascorbate metabolism protein UlaG (beta-lactamase superfamily)
MWSSEAGAAKQPTTPIRFRWLGTAGIELVFPDLVIVIDPYFSRVPPWKLWLGHVTPDRALIADQIRRCDLLLVTHAHFDHIMDVPEIVHNTGAMAVGSANSCSLLEALGVSQSCIHEINPGDQISSGEVRIEVREARHRRIPGFSPGPLHQDIRPPLRARRYRMDHCYSFLISVNGTRLLTDPGERPNDAVAADVLFVHPGKNDGYYRSLLRLVQPRITIPIHWDDFFHPLSEPLRPYWKPPELAFPPLQRIDLKGFERTHRTLCPSGRVLEPEILRSYDLGAMIYAQPRCAHEE